MNDSKKNAMDGEEVLKRNSEREMSNRDTLRVALNPKSVAIIGARGPVTDGVGRLRAARQAPISPGLGRSLPAAKTFATSIGAR
jgi:hypothetical protein